MPKATETLFEREEVARRRRPQQRRSEQTVDRIKRAMLEVITQEGYAAASTNRVARQAGVNISSLYQYFPNRQAIALALYEGVSSELARRVHRELLADMTVPMEEGIPQMLARLLDFMEHEQVVLMQLIEELPEIGESVQALSLENLVHQTSRVYLEQHLGKLDRAAMACKLFFVQTFGMALIRSYIRQRPQGLSKARFLDELSNLILTYLRQAPTKTAPGR